MNKSVLFLCCVILCSGCYVSKVLTTEIPTLPTREFKSPPQKFIVANVYDVKKASVRDNKEKLFEELIDLTVRHTSNEINRRSEIPATFREGLTVINPRPDSVMNALMSEHRASHAILVKSFNSYFDQTEVVVTQTEEGKNREAHYDIIVDIGYSLYDGAGHHFDTLISVRKYHSSRSVLSGLLAAGPNIVSNSSDAMEGIFANVDIYLKSFFKGREKRTRNVFISKDFKEMKNAMDAADYERAFEESEKLIQADKNMVAAMAAYNCAVMLEYLGQYNKVKHYLEQSLAKYRLPETEIMLQDYRLFKSIH